MIASVTSSGQFIAFRLANTLLASPLTQVDEVADPLPVNLVGGTKTWFMGIAACRGNLLPVTDLGDYAMSAPSRDQPQAKLLLVSHCGETVGLTVDEVIGFSEAEDSASSSEALHCPSNDSAATDPLSATPLQSLVTGRISLGDGWATVIDLTKLLEQESFVSVGLAQ